jgi:hypothetical protein
MQGDPGGVRSPVVFSFGKEEAFLISGFSEIVVLDPSLAAQRRKTSHPQNLVFIVTLSLASLLSDGAHLIVPAKNGLNSRTAGFPVPHRSRGVLGV